MSQLTASTEYTVKLQAIAGPKRSRIISTVFTTSEPKTLYYCVSAEMQLHFMIMDSWLWRHWIKLSCPWSNTCLFLSQLEFCTSILKTARRLCWMETQSQACTPFTCVEMRISPCRSTAIWPLMEAAGLWVIFSQITCRIERFAVLILGKFFNGIVHSKMKTFHPTCHSKCVSPIVFHARMKVMQGLE